MREFENTLSEWLQSAGIQDCGILVGVSGGADSIALLRGLAALKQALSLRVIVGHVDHELRTASVEDAAWVAAECAALGVPSETAEVNVAEVAERTGGGIEETARRVRYELLSGIAVDHDCQCLAVGHTADDQAETILHHLVRGTGLGGLRGMPAERELSSGIRLIRPLLSVRRNEAVTYLSELGQEYREDSSNTDPAFTRNRIRNSLLPLLRDQFNPRVEEALLRLGGQAKELQQMIEDLAENLLQAVTLDAQPDHIRINCDGFESSARPLVRETLKRLWDQQGWPVGGMSYQHWDDLAKLALDSEEGAAMQLPGGIDARRRSALLVISRSGANCD